MISIIVPVYNVASYLQQCLSSIVNQTYSSLEIILVDDGSTDGSGELCDQLALTDSRIKVIHKENGGLSSARNAGLKVVSGDFVGFVDSDDYVVADMYEKLVAALYKYPEAGVSSVQIYSFTDGKDDFKPAKEIWVKSVENFIPASEYCISTVGNLTPVMVWNKLYRRELLKDVSFLEGRNNEDQRFQFDLAKKLKERNLGLIEIPSFGYYYRQRETSIIYSSKKPVKVDSLRNLSEMIKDESLTSKEHEVVYLKYARFLSSFIDAMLMNKNWKRDYWNEFYPQMKFFSLPFLKKKLSRKYFLIFSIQRYVPVARMLMLRMKY